MKKGDRVIYNGVTAHDLTRGSIYTLAHDYKNNGRIDLIDDVGDPHSVDFSDVTTIDEKSVSYDYIKPDHHKIGEGDVIDAYVKIHGSDGIRDAIGFLRLSDFKYRLRAGKKPNEPIEREIEKALECMRRVEELTNQIEVKTK